MDKVTDEAESTAKTSHRTYFPRPRNIHRHLDTRLIAMVIATEHPTPSNHLSLESTALTPSFGSTPGFFSAEFSNLNPFDVDFHDATASPLRVEHFLGTPPPHYSTASHDTPRSVVLRRNYDPSLVSPGPRVSSMNPVRSSTLKDSSTDAESSSSRLPPSPQHSPNALNPAFLEKSNADYRTSYILPPPVHARYGSSRGVHGEVTPPTDESRSPENKYSKSKSQNKKSTSTKKRKFEADMDIKSQREESMPNDDRGMNFNGGSSDNRRKKFLERNRLAAFKCRQKKKEWAHNLEEQARYQAQENKLLRVTVSQLRDECLYLKNFLLSTHSGCSCVGVKNYLMKEAQLSQQVVGMGEVMPTANLVHPGMDMGREYPRMVGMHHPMDDRRRSESIGSRITISDGPPQSTSPQQ